MPGLAVRAAGMVTSVGFNGATSCAAMRAGIRRVRPTNLWDKRSGQFLPAGRVSLPHWWVGLGKLAEMAAPAIQECLTAAGPVSSQRIPLLLGVSAPDRPFRFAGLDAEILGEISRRLGCELHPASRVVPRDHVATVVALREAAELMANDKVPCVIIAGVDSLVEQDLVEYYLKQRRILTQKNFNGFSVGEAAGALLVVPAEGSPRGTLKVLGMGLARESATIDSEDPLRAEGLTQAIRSAFLESDTTYEDVQYRITDLNGEHYKFKEMALAMVRFQGKPKGRLFDLWHPIEYIGDVGAAIGPIVLAVALHAGQKGYGSGPTVLCTLGNDNGERAAMVVRYE